MLPATCVSEETFVTLKKHLIKLLPAICVIHFMWKTICEKQFEVIKQLSSVAVILNSEKTEWRYKVLATRAIVWQFVQFMKICENLWNFYILLKWTGPILCVLHCVLGLLTSDKQDNQTCSCMDNLPGWEPLQHFRSCINCKYWVASGGRASRPSVKLLVHHSKSQSHLSQSIDHVLCYHTACVISHWQKITLRAAVVWENYKSTLWAARCVREFMWIVHGHKPWQCEYFTLAKTHTVSRKVCGREFMWIVHGHKPWQCEYFTPISILDHY